MVQVIRQVPRDDLKCNVGMLLNIFRMGIINASDPKAFSKDACLNTRN
jgi:hypothetical protein